MDVKFLSRREIDDFLTKVGEKFFVVCFLKKDGTHRRMNCRTGVAKFVKGTGHPTPDHLIGVWEQASGTGADAYRSVDRGRVLYLKCGELELGSPEAI